ncbi:MAG TPA: hypothetical protein VGV89_05180 [Thermoplasmata archaeon]|nr:hypothetical protein [Thermoplasmata archaeon]
MPPAPNPEPSGPSLGGGALPRLALPPFRPPVLVGRPPLILTRSRTPPAPDPTPEPVVAAQSGSMFEVRCFTCGRTGRLPVRPGVSLRPEDIICPTCRAKRPRSAIPRSLRSGYLRPPLPAGDPAVQY